MSAIITKSLFRTGSIFVIVTGALITFLGMDEDMFTIMGPILMILGILFLITGIFSKGASDTSQGRILGIILILSGILAIAGMFAGEIGFILMISGAVFILLIFLIWPCLCCQSQKGISSQVIGVASSHDRISIGEISGITKLDEKIVRETIYAAIGTGRLRGKIEGDTFIRGAPSTTTYAAPTTTTREREIVKVLVICPYCGAKTEQGIGKCQNCQADL